MIDIRINGVDEIKIYLQKFMEAKDRVTEDIYKHMMEGTKVEFNSTLGCYAVNPEFLIWTLNNARNGENDFNFNLPRKKIKSNLKRSLR